MDEGYKKSGGTGYGLIAYTEKTDGNTLSLLSGAMVEVAEWIEAASGFFLGHVKMAVAMSEKTMTLNLTDLKRGVEHHNGPMPHGVRADIKFMSAVVDVDRVELSEVMKRTFTKNGFKVKDDRKKIVEFR